MKRRFERSGVPEVLCLILATLVFGAASLDAKVGGSILAPRGQAAAQPRPTLKERILEIPPATMIEVRLLNKHKIRGRLGEVTDEGFSLTTAQGGKIATEKIAFTDLKSFKKVEGGKAGRAVLYGLAGLGLLLVGITVWAAAAASSSN